MIHVDTVCCEFARNHDIHVEVENETETWSNKQIFIGYGGNISEPIRKEKHHFNPSNIKQFVGSYKQICAKHSTQIIHRLNNVTSYTLTITNILDFIFHYLNTQLRARILILGKFKNFCFDFALWFQIDSTHHLASRTPYHS